MLLQRNLIDEFQRHENSSFFDEIKDCMQFRSYVEAKIKNERKMT